MFITYTKYPPNSKKVKGYNGVISFASRYGSVRLICQSPHGKSETIILQELVHLAGMFNLISQSQIMDKDVKVEPVNHSGLNLYNRHRKLIATAPQDNGILVLDQGLELAEHTDIDDSRLLALKTTEHGSQHDTDQRILWLRCVAHGCLKA
jgi:hypothetical protein